jgi:hypothetical protein
MDEYRVPTVTLDVEVLCVDGRVLSGQVFMPALSAVHAGPPEPEEWINTPSPFFPFAGRGQVNLLLNKQQVLALIAPAAEAVEAGEDPADPVQPDLPTRRVSIEADRHRFDGLLTIDMPLNQQRVLDYLNRRDLFLLLHLDDGRRCLIRKACITTLSELKGA